jgi:carboxypeptidase Taq
MKAYLKLAEKFETMSGLYNATAILHWDTSVMMPSGSSEDRANQISTIYAVCHQMITSQEVSDLLDEAEQNTTDLNPWQQKNLKLMRRDWIHSNAIDEKLLKEFTKTTSECEMRWRTARADNDFKTFSFFLKKVLKLSREIAERKAEILNLSKYNALLDQYDSGRRSEEIDEVFSGLKNFLPGFIEQVKEHQSKNCQFTKPEGNSQQKAERTWHAPYEANRFQL